MSHSKYLNIILVFCMLWLALSGTGAASQVHAQTPETGTGSATDDALPVDQLPEVAEISTVPGSVNLIDSDDWFKPLPYNTQAGVESVVLWDNGPLVTHPGGGYNGADASRLQTDLAMNTLGFGNQLSYGNHMADEFEVTASSGWQIENITFFTYQTDTYTDPPISTITGVYLQIWDGPPNDAGSSVIFGDLTTNRIIDTYWTGIYRDSGTTPVVANRPIMTAVAGVNVSLSQGTYWLDWMVDGTGTSGPWAPPITILGQTTTGNALQYTTSSGAWAPANDSGTLTQQGMPFVVIGTVNSGPPSWKSIAPINGVGRSRPAAAAVNGKIYLIGGEITADPFRANTVDEYDPKFNSWTTQTGLMPTPASNICAAVIGTDIYIPGGYNGAYLNTLQVYHTTSDTWSTIATDPLPVGLSGPGCAALNGLLYVFGGSSASGYQSAAYVYNPAAAAGVRWTTLPSMAYARAFLAGVAANGKIYAIGGRDLGIPNFNYVEAYNPADGAWHTVTHMLEPRAGVGAYAVGNSIYACGGGWSAYLDTCEVYDTTQGYAGSWTSHPAVMIEGRRTFGYANIGPVLYAIAGWNGGFMTSAERWSYESFLPMIMNRPFTILGFDSQFNGDGTGWVAHSGYWSVGPEHLHTSGLDNLWSTASYTDTFTNLDYSARMKRLGCETCASNLLIRGTPDPLGLEYYWYDYYSFQYSRDGYFSVFKRVNGVSGLLQGWTYTDAIHQGDAWNILRVFANGSTLYFTINGTLVWSGTDIDLTSGRVGIGMYGSTATGDELRVDWATLYTDVEGTIMSDTVSPEQQLLNDAANLNPVGDETGHMP